MDYSRAQLSGLTRFYLQSYLAATTQQHDRHASTVGFQSAAMRVIDATLPAFDNEGLTLSTRNMLDVHSISILKHLVNFAAANVSEFLNCK